MLVARREKNEIGLKLAKCNYFLFTFYHFLPFCHLQTLSAWNSLKFVIWERVKSYGLYLKHFKTCMGFWQPLIHYFFYHRVTSFYDSYLRKKPFENIVGKGENAGNHPSNSDSNFVVSFILSPGIAFS